MRLVTLCAAVLLTTTGCATMGSAVDDVRSTAARMAQAAKQHAQAVIARQQHYMAEHDVLKTFEDASEHSESEVLKVLHAARSQSATGAIAARGGSTAVAKAAVPPAKAGVSLSGNGSSSGSGGFHWPVEAGVISSEYGARWGKLHKGIDIAADVGEPVYAVADGEVIYAGDGLRGYGNVVIIEHANRVSSLYAHNSELKVKQGDRVSQGALIALIGNTGHSTGPHVHFELRQADVAVNPHSMLPVTTLADATSVPYAKSVGALSARR